MNFDFALILTALAGLSGLIWLADYLLFARARKLHNATLSDSETHQREAWVVEQARAFFPVLLIVLAIRSFWFEPFKIPSGSMIPTLLVGDFIVVNKFAYGLRLPVLNNKIVSIGEPERGDIVIFRRPRDPQMSVDSQEGLTYVKRLTGMPGDRISYQDHQLTINDVAVPRSQIGNYLGEAQSLQDSDTNLFEEDLLGHKHQTLGKPASDPRINGEWTVPAGHYFMMGDNRDGSSDSRTWGFVPEANLVGRASFIWFHFDLQRKGWVAWSRIGRAVK